SQHRRRRPCNCRSSTRRQRPRGRGPACATSTGATGATISTTWCCLISATAPCACPTGSCWCIAAARSRSTRSCGRHEPANIATPRVSLSLDKIYTWRAATARADELPWLRLLWLAAAAQAAVLCVSPLTAIETPLSYLTAYWDDFFYYLQIARNLATDFRS